MLPVPYHILIDIRYKLKTIVKITLYLNKNHQRIFEKAFASNPYSSKAVKLERRPIYLSCKFSYTALTFALHTIKLLIRFNETYMSHLCILLLNATVLACFLFVIFHLL